MEKDLAEMGMPTAFSNYADFTAMENDPNEDLKVDKVIHQAFVEVNEEGTEAAAATGIIVGGTSEPDIPIFYADHSLIFIIQDINSGTILFMGRVINPTI